MYCPGCEVGESVAECYAAKPRRGWSQRPRKALQCASPATCLSEACISRRNVKILIETHKRMSALHLLNGLPVLIEGIVFHCNISI